MKVEILRQVMISGEPAMAGSILDVSDDDGRLLIGLGKAAKHEEKSAACAAKPPEKEESPASTKKPTTRRSSK